MTITVTQIQQQLADREAIRDVLMRYCRGIDRLDVDLLRSTYWPDAHDEHLEFAGNIEQFIDYCQPILGAMRWTSHMIGNILIAIDGNRAEVESYFQGVHSVPNADGVRRDHVAGGRYLDIFEKRNDEWRIFERFVVTDWFRDYADTGDWNVGPFGMKVERGDQKPADKSYSFFRQLAGLAD
jgi:hypothetical protein